MRDLFSSIRKPEKVGEGALFLPDELGMQQESILLQIHSVIEQAPLRRLMTPGGRAFSVRMTNCGVLGWHSDARGYRYVSHDPLTGRAWPAMPESWADLARTAAAKAGFAAFQPQACLINCYEPGSRMGLHQDRDEQDLSSPIVSMSIGSTARFLFGSQLKEDQLTSLFLESGDVLVWGGPSRLSYHGVAPLVRSDHPLTGELRWNLTFRRVVGDDAPRRVDQSVSY